MPGPTHSLLPNKPTERGTGRAGFTLVEVALAALVIGLGILTLFGLARIGAQSAAEAEDETRAALFAENVFGALNAVNQSLNLDTHALAWTNFWVDFKDGEESLPDVAIDHWQSDDPYEAPTIYGDARRRTNHYFSVSHRESSTAPLPEVRVVYRLSVNLTNYPSFYAEPNLAVVVLEVWPTRSTIVRHDGALPDRPPTTPYPFQARFQHHGPLP